MQLLLTKFVNIRKPDYESSERPLNPKHVHFLNDVLNKKCKKCNSVKPPMSHHCSICGRCVARMDHHCPWVNNCVGFYNQKFFLQFLIYVFLGSFHALFFIVRAGYLCFDKNCFLFQATSNVVLGILSVFMGLLFGIFVIIMFVD